MKKIAWTTGTGWVPIGTSTTRFSGVFNGQNFSISGLYISNSTVANVGLFGALSSNSHVYDLDLLDIEINNSTSSSVDSAGGLVGKLDGGKLENIFVSGSIRDDAKNIWEIGGVVGNAKLINMSNCSSTVNIVGANYLGGLIGLNFRGSVSTSRWDGNIEGAGTIGGLIGWNEGAIVSDSHTSGSVSGESYFIGGLIGYNREYSTWVETGEIRDCSSSALVTGEAEVGGLVGILEGDLTFIETSYATGNVVGLQDSSDLGGLVGEVSQGASVRKSFASGNVVGEDYVGGLVGMVNGFISDSYAKGNVSEITGGYQDGYRIGGLIGMQSGGEIHNSYSVGIVTAFSNSDVGGLFGLNSAPVISNSFWDMESSLMTTSAGGTGKTTAQMKSIGTYNDTSTEGLDEEWNILGIEVFDPENPSIWYIESGADYPRLFYEYTGWDGGGEEENPVVEEPTEEPVTEDTQQGQLPNTGMDIFPFILSMILIFTGYLLIKPRKKIL